MTSSIHTFRRLHQAGSPLLLPNAWDAGTARLSESLGAQAIATTSAGVCWARGYADGNATPTGVLLATVQEITRVVGVPVSVDIEGGYSSDPAAVAELVARVADAGAVGINLEDGIDAPALLCAKIEAVKARAAGLGVDLFVNARTDVYLRGMAKGTAAVDEVLRRAALYRAAGCDGVFVPGLSEPGAIGTIAQGIGALPLNLMLVRGLPPLAELQALGVRRLSAGSAIAQAALGQVRTLVAAYLAGDVDAVLTTPAAEYGRMNQLFPAAR